MLCFRDVLLRWSLAWCVTKLTRTTCNLRKPRKWSAGLVVLTEMISMQVDGNLITEVGRWFGANNWKKTGFQPALDRSWCSLTVFFYLKILQDTVSVSRKNPAGMLSLHRQAVVCKLGLNVRSDLRIFCRVFLAQITNKLIKALINLINWQDESDFCSKKVGFIHSSYWWGESPGCSPHGGFLVIRCCLPWLLGFFVRKWKWDVSTRVRIWVGMLLPYGVP